MHERASTSDAPASHTACVSPTALRACQNEKHDVARAVSVACQAVEDGDGGRTAAATAADDVGLEAQTLIKSWTVSGFASVVLSVSLACVKFGACACALDTIFQFCMHACIGRRPLYTREEDFVDTSQRHLLSVITAAPCFLQPLHAASETLLMCTSCMCSAARTQSQSGIRPLTDRVRQPMPVMHARA
jgi:hypothetical protein